MDQPEPARARVDSGRWPIFDLIAQGMPEPDPKVHAEMERRMAEAEVRLEEWKRRRREQQAAGDAA